MMQTYKQQRITWLKKELTKRINTTIDPCKLILFITKLYEKAYCGLDLITALEDTTVAPHLLPEKRYELLFHFSRVRKEFRNEKLIMWFVLYFAYLSSNVSLENISFM
jgi:hypothetical protein